MKTYFFSNSTDRTNFITSKGEDLTTAPIDEKNITTDWIDSLFDCEEYDYNKGEWLGNIEGVAMCVRCSSNKATFAKQDQDKDIKAVLDFVCEILQEGNDDYLTAVIVCDANHFEISFYFTED